MSEYGKKEARVITAGCLVLAGTGVASSVSPAIESTLNLWIGLPVAVVSGGALLVVVVKQVWSWVITELEFRRKPPTRDDVDEVEWRA